MCFRKGKREAKKRKKEAEKKHELLATLNLESYSEDEIIYLSERVIGQIVWHDDKAVECRKWHEDLQIIAISLTSAASFLALLSTTFPECAPWISIISAGLGTGAAIFLSIDKLKKFQERHTQYRQTCERLKQELWLYRRKSGEYAGPGEPDNNQLFVDRIESILATDTGNWAQLNERKEA